MSSDGLLHGQVGPMRGEDMADPEDANDAFDLSPEQLNLLEHLNQVVRRDNRNLGIVLGLLFIFGLGLTMVVAGAVWWVADRSHYAVDLMIVGGIEILVAIAIGLVMRFSSRSPQNDPVMR